MSWLKLSGSDDRFAIEMNVSTTSPNSVVVLSSSDNRADINSRTISCVVPVYNSELTLPTLVEKLCQALPKLAAQWEIILINDGSTDQSWHVICNLAKKHANLRGINLMRNYGQHNALLCGIRACSYQITVTLDDDLQNPIDEMEKLILKIDEGSDLVYGTSENRKNGWSRNLFSQLVRLCWQKVLGAKALSHISSYRAFRTDIRNEFEAFSNPSVAIDVLLAWSTEKVCHVSVRHDPRLLGASNYDLPRLLNLASTMTTGFSPAPLRFAIGCGIALVLLGLGYLIYIFIGFGLHGGFTLGISFLSGLVIIFAGVHLITLGIIGEYVACIYQTMLGRLPYKVKSITATAETAAQGQ